MGETNRQNRRRDSGHGILYWMGCVLLVLSLASTCFLCGLLAKYTTQSSGGDSARVAKGGNIVLWEHKANLENGIYVLDESKNVRSNTYDKVIPGVDIAKDPYIQTSLAGSEVDYKLYLKVTKSDAFPDTVTFDLTSDWEYDKEKDVYLYTGNLERFREEDGKIQVLKDNKLKVSEHFIGDDGKTKPQSFSLTFQAWIVQVD